MTMKRLAIHLLLGVATALSLQAQDLQVINYQGRLSGGVAGFQGSGQFKFAILNNRDAMLWATLPEPEIGATDVLPSTIALPVQNGAYAVRLGDVSLGMPALDKARLRGPLKLRVWFRDPQHGWQRMANDQPLTLDETAATENRDGLITAAQADEILREIRSLRALVEQQQKTPVPSAPAAPTTATVVLGNSPSLGSVNAPLVLVEFTDFQCSFCRRFHDTVFPELKKKFIDSGKVRFVSRNLPLSFHNQAELAAQAALCAHAQGKFWEMREELFTNSTSLSPETINKAAANTGLDMARFRAGLEAKTFAPDVLADGKAAADNKITGTPTFVLAKAGGNTVTGRLIVGAKPFAAFETEIQQLLDSKAPVVAAVTATPAPAKANLPNLTWIETKALLAAHRVLLVDARITTAYEAGHIPGAVSLPPNVSEEELIKFKTKYDPKTTPLVVYCGSVDCPLSGQLAEKLIRQFGYTDVRLMPGGIVEWRLAEQSPTPVTASVTRQGT